MGVASHRHYPVLLLTVLAASAACQSPSEPNGICGRAPATPYDRIMEGDGGVLYHVGVAGTLHVETGVTYPCGGGEGPWDAMATLTAPGGEVSQVPITWTARSRFDTNRSADLEIRPSVGGWYRVVATLPEGLEPREVVRDIFVPEQGPLVPEVTLPTAACARIGRTTRGTWICNGWAMTASSLVYQFDAPRAFGPVVGGNAVWHWDADGKLVRSVDSDSGWVESARVAFNLAGDPVRMVATEDALFVRTWYGLDRYRFVAPASIERDRIDLATDPGDDLLLVDGASVFTLRNDAAAQGTSTACRYLADQAGFAPAPNGCQVLSGRIFGASRGGIWVTTGGAFELTYQRFEGTAWATKARALQPLPTDLPIPSSVNVKRWNTAFYYRYAFPGALSVGVPLIARVSPALLTDLDEPFLAPILRGPDIIFVVPWPDARFKFGISEPGGYFSANPVVSIAQTPIYREP